MNQRDKKTFYELVSQSMIYLYGSWLKALERNQSKMPPDFQLSIKETMLCVDRVLNRLDVRRMSDIRMAFDNEL